jgi:hypothetical protein
MRQTFKICWIAAVPCTGTRGMVDVQMAIVLLLSFGTASHQVYACKDNWYCFCQQMEELSYSTGRETQAGYYIQEGC